MNIPLYLAIARRYAVLLGVGLVVAVLAGLLAGFRIGSGGLEPRTPTSYSAATTVMLQDPDRPLFALEGSPLTEDEQQQGGAAVRQNVSSLAGLYAWVITGDQIRERVEAQIGPLESGERLTGVQRTTPPAGSEAFPGRGSLPIVDIVGVADSAARAEAISRTATEQFEQYVTEQQSLQGLAAGQRVAITELRVGPAIAGEESNPVVPAVVIALAVFLCFIGLVVLRWNMSGKGGGTRAGEADQVDVTDHPGFSVDNTAPRGMPVLGRTES